MKADDFNAYFHSVFTTDNGIIKPSTSRYNDDVRLPNAPTISQAGVRSLLLSLNERKSCGPDGIPNTFLKRYAEPVSGYLYLIYSKSIEDCCLPADWKTAKITAIHKSGDKSSPGNCRPISITSTCGKILEHIVLKFLTEFIESNNILHPNQHGFRSGLSTVTQLVETLHDLAQGINERSQTDVIFIDFSKAFDRVSHAKLLFKLNNLLGDGPVLRWIRNYLTDRHQFVQFGNHYSDMAPVLSGVPQGSVLAPLLFLIFINDLAYQVDVPIRLFADDCMLYTEVQNLEDQLKLNTSLKKIAEWCDDWQMRINTDKTVCMSITKKTIKLNVSYNFDNATIQNVNHYKYLGLTISSDLDWSEHVRQVTKKALNKLFLVKRALSFSTHETKLLAYVTFVRLRIRYSCLVSSHCIWHNHSGEGSA